MRNEMKDRRVRLAVTKLNDRNILEDLKMAELIAGREK
jgi:hypothetical protein